MTAEHWARIKEIVNDTLECDPAARDAFLDEACGGDAEVRREVDRLLAVNTGSDAFLEPLPSEVISACFEDVQQGGFVGHRIGRYRVIRRIDAGGMGAVFEAEQENPRRTVALKIIRPGLATPPMLRRFEYETQVLGRLQHPGIAQIHEAGTFDLGDGARPFFAMELVEGLPVHEYAEHHGLSTRQRLELVARIGDAVEHAHQKGVIHRDLKPANVLVTEAGQPKILDFGVARAIDADLQAGTIPHTATGELIGTLRYMSPEQIAGDPGELDTRSDIYALGVLCYELLTGRLPYDVGSGTIAQVSRTILEDDPVPLSSASRALRGDLDTIVSKTLEKDKARRYQSIADLAADIRRYLADEPIAARPPSAFYQIRKFSKRHRALVTGAALIAVVAVAGAVFYRMEARRAGLEAANARYEADKYRAVHDFIVNDFLWEVLSRVGASLPEHDTQVAELVDAAAADIDARFADEPLHAAAARNQVATMYYNLGRFDEAETLFAVCLDTRLRLLGGEHRDTLNATNNLGLVKMRLGRIDEAETYYRRALEGRRRTLGDEHSDTLISMNNLAALLRRTGELAEAERLLRAAVGVQRRVRGVRHSDTLASQSNLATVMADLGDDEAAESLHRETVTALEDTLGAEHVTTLVATSRLGQMLLDRQRAAEAEDLFRRSAATTTAPAPPRLVSPGSLTGRRVVVLSGHEPRACDKERRTLWARPSRCRAGPWWIAAQIPAGSQTEGVVR
jgi:tetratricopeptide (TPR) repeat protein